MLHRFNQQLYTGYSRKTTTTTTSTHSTASIIVISAPSLYLCVPCLHLCVTRLWLYDAVTLFFSDTERPDSVALSIRLGALLPPASAALVGCCTVIGQGTVGVGVVVCCGVSDWLREQLLLKLLHSAPQCCSHCPRNRRPTHDLTSSPHFSRKFTSSTYGLVRYTHTHNHT